MSFIVGDLNARCGDKVCELTSAGLAYSPIDKAQNENGRQMLQICKDNNILVLKTTGGVSVKILVFSDSCSKFSLLSNLFYGIRKFGSFSSELADFSGWVVAPGDHFRPFGHFQ